jgi:uncharacterized membrane protein YbhN (UPF0104 family)
VCGGAAAGLTGQRSCSVGRSATAAWFASGAKPQAPGGAPDARVPLGSGATAGLVAISKRRTEQIKARGREIGCVLPMCGRMAQLILDLMENNGNSSAACMRSFGLPCAGRAPDRRDLTVVDAETRRVARRLRPLRLKRVGRRVATTGLLVALGALLLAAVPRLRGVLGEIRHLGAGWIAVAVTLEVASDVGFVVVFRLFFDRLEARDARLLAWAGQGSGALIPGGGAGGLAVGGWLIHLTGVPVRWIARRSAGLFFLGGAVSSAALVGAGLALIAGAPGLHGLPTVVLPTVLAAIGTLLIAALPAILGSWPRAPRWLGAIAIGVREAEQATFHRRPSWRLVGALGYLGFDIAVLWVVLRAIGPAPSIAAVILAYSIGYAANSLPIPGGIGVLDAGLTGALVLYGVSPAHAAAAVIVYHAIAFWVPGLGGLLAYLRLRPRLLGTGAQTHADPLQPTPEKPASEEARHTRTRIDAQPSHHRWVAAHRRSRAHPVPRAMRPAQNAAPPRHPPPVDGAEHRRDHSEPMMLG